MIFYKLIKWVMHWLYVEVTQHLQNKTIIKTSHRRFNPPDSVKNSILFSYRTARQKHKLIFSRNIDLFRITMIALSEDVQFLKRLKLAI
jgi:hypothetical protein